jgi:hypothetical protein
MTITVDTANITVATPQTNESSPSTFSHTCGANVDALVVVVTIYDTSDTDGVVSGVKYNNVSFDTPAATIYYDALCDGHCSIWLLPSPITGDSYTVEVSFGGTVTDFEAAAIGIEGTVGTFAKDSNGTPNTGTTGNLTIAWDTVETNTIVFSCSLDDQGTAGKVHPQSTEIYNVDVTDIVSAQYEIRTQSGSQTQTIVDDDGDEDWVIVGAAFKEVAGTPNISESDNANVGESISVELDDLAIAVSDNTGVGEIAPTVGVEGGEPEIGVTDNTGVTDAITMELDDLEISVSDNAGVGESHSVDSLLSEISVSDNTAVADSNPVVDVPEEASVSDDTGVTDTLPTFYYDNINVSDSVSVEIVTVGDLEIEVSDNVGVTDTSQEVYFEFDISVTDNAGVADAPAVQLDSFNVSVSDNTGVSDSPEVDIPLEIAVSDNTGTADSLAATLDDLEISVSDNTGVSDTPGVEFVFEISVTDNVGVADAPQVIEPDPREISVSDNANVGESTNVTSQEFQIIASDNATVADSVTVSLDDLEIDVSDGVTLTDVSTIAPLLAEIDVSDNTAVGEGTIDVDIVSDEVDISISDDTGVADSSTVLIPEYFIQVSDGVGVSESLTILLPEYYISVSDNVNVADTVTMGGITYSVSVTDGLTLADALGASVILEIYESDNLNLTDTIIRVRTGEYDGLIEVALDSRDNKVSLADRDFDIELDERTNKVKVASR